MFSNYPNLRFCKVRKGTKKPFELDWTKKPYKWEEVAGYITSEQNYGVLCGHGDLAVIDCDDQSKVLEKHIYRFLPNTFRVKTGSGGLHNYFFIPGLNKKVLLTTLVDGTEKHWGEVQSVGTQVIGPGSIHPNGNKYELLNDVPIATITIEQLYEVIKPFMKQIQEAEETSVYERKDFGSESDIDSLSVASIWGTSGLRKQGDEYCGRHPIHGSDTGMNFWINPGKNTWHCFRCDSGGGPLSAIAVKEGIISCSEARRGNLRGEKVLQTLEKARASYGLKEKFDLSKLPIQQSGTKNDDLVLWTYNDFEKLAKDTNFIVQDVIYPKTVTMLYSPPGEFKSLLAMLMAMKIANGKDWMGFETKKNPVLYCDKENNDQILKERLTYLFKGENFEDKDMPLYILRRNGDLLDSKFIDKLKKTIRDNKIKVVFFDTLHRFADYDENKSDDLNRLYTFVFQPIVDEFACSIIFLHHTKKDGGYRGSGDFLGMVDTAYAVYRDKPNGSSKSNKFRIVNEKCRSGEIEQIIGEIDFGNDYIKILRNSLQAENENNINKLKELTQKVRSLFKPEDKLKQKDIEDRLQIEGYEFSLATLRRTLGWLVANNYLDKNEKREYLLL